MDFLWHKVSEKKKKEIREQAKKIMSNFSKKLGKVKGEISEVYEGEIPVWREEGKGESLDLDGKIMLDNAPNSKKDFIIGEKAEW